MTTRRSLVPPMGFAGAKDVAENYPYIDPDDVLLCVVHLFKNNNLLALQIDGEVRNAAIKGRKLSVFNYLFADNEQLIPGASYGIAGFRLRSPEDRAAYLSDLLAGSA